MKLAPRILLFLMSAALAGVVVAQVKDPANRNESGLPRAPLNGALPGTTCSGAGGSNCSASILDLGNVVSTFRLENCTPAGDINVGIDTTHSWVGDLVYTLENDNTGTTVTIIDRPGSVGGLGCSGDDIFAVLDDSAATPVEDECAAAVPTIDGTFIPNNALSAFTNEDGDGTWILTVTDLAGADSGTLNDWSIQCSVAERIVVPTLDQVGLAVLVLLLAGGSFLVLRRRRNA